MGSQTTFVQILFSGKVFSRPRVRQTPVLSLSFPFPVDTGLGKWAPLVLELALLPKTLWLKTTIVHREVPSQPQRTA